MIAGSVSDHVGRRPALLIALAIEMAGMLLFAEAHSVSWLLAARILQGVATGIAMGAISAALLDLQPESRPRLGALVGVAAPLTGLAIGALGTGVLVQFGPAPMRLVYWLLFGAFALAVLVPRAKPPLARDGHRARSSPAARQPGSASLRAACACASASLRAWRASSAS